MFEKFEKGTIIALFINSKDGAEIYRILSPEEKCFLLCDKSFIRFSRTSVNFQSQKSKLFVYLIFNHIHFLISFVFRQDAGDDIISQKSLDAVKELIHFLKERKFILK